MQGPALYEIPGRMETAGQVYSFGKLWKPVSSVRESFPYVKPRPGDAKTQRLWYHIPRAREGSMKNQIHKIRSI